MKNIFKNMDKRLFFVTIILFIIGVIMIYSASNITAYVINDANPARYFVRQLFFLGLGFVGAYILIKIPVKRYYALTLFGIFGATFAIAMLALYGQIVNGASNWIGYKGFGIQPSEFVKVFIIPLYALYYDTKKVYSYKNVKTWIPPIISGIIGFFIVLQNDFGTAFIFLMLSVVLFFLCSTSKQSKRFMFLACIAISMFGGMVLLTFGDKILDQDKRDRFNFFNPCERYLNTGNQLCNGYIAINGGGLLGKGLGNSTQKYLYLPESHTDFIFAIFIEEAGLVGGVVLMALYGYTIYRIIAIGKKSKINRNKNICYGVSIYLFLHIFINLGGVLGIIPVTGIPLAFLSYGGTYCWCTIGALTMVQRVYIENKTNN